MEWQKLKHLFIHNDGSLPDIYVEQLSESELISIYDWVRSLTEVYGDPSVWDIRAGADVKVSQLTRSPAEMYVEGLIEPFRHGLETIAVNGVAIPPLTICVESHSSLSFDYAMGVHWGAAEVTALFQLLSFIRRNAPRCRVFQTWESSYDKPNPEFEDEFEKFVATAV